MKTNLKEKFDKIKDHWHPYIIGDLNDNYVKLAKLQGDFVWHQHDLEDELFVVISGTLMMDFKDGTTVETRAGEVILVPKGVQHKPWTREGEEVCVMLVEPKSTKHTGEVKSAKTVEDLTWI